ncbi:MAG: flagellar basal body P-ring formation protein FlgA [Selenomonadaceae bacterium]|nr:flagellar basal body P-ring formation protein FlgA [Selenomonadaceae bacterium]
MKKIFIAALLLMMSLTPRTFAFTITGAEVEAVAFDALERALDERGETRRHEIIFTQRAADMKLPEGVVDIKATLPVPISYLSLTPVRATVFVNGRLYRTVSFTARIKVYDSVIVANHDLRIEVPVTAADFHIAEVVIDGRNEYVKDVSEVVGLVPHRYIRGGSPVTKAYFQQPVVVNSGQRVNIILNHNGIKASAKGIIMTRARVGALVKVKNEASGKILTARVIDASTVEVTM